MQMQWKKPSHLKYTELCMFIDSQIPAIGEEIAPPEVENTVYNYLWLLVKALAIKKCMFNNFADYDGYSFYAATRLYFALKRNYQNQGKTIKGKLIKPIKSCLNYTKALLYPMKIEYQRETYAEVLSEENVNKKFDAITYKEKLKDSIKDSQTSSLFRAYIQDIFTRSDKILAEVLKSIPFKNNSVEYKWIKVSIILNVLNNIKLHNKLDFEAPSITLWHLPKSMQNYIRVLIKEFCTKIKQEIIDCGQQASLEDPIIENLLKNPSGDYIDYES